MRTAVCLLMGYFIGTINPAFLLGKKKGLDIRKVGSGNAGASNAVIMLGKMTGVFCGLFDIFKAFLAFRLAKYLFPTLQYAAILCGTACILGHIFPVWMKFSGGKGLACVGGVLLAYNWKLFFLILAIEIVLILIVDYIFVVALSVSVIFPVIYIVQTGDWIGTLFLLVITVVMFFKHADNFQRIRDKKEVRFSFLWRREQEIERLRDKYPELNIEEYIAPERGRK